MFIWRSISSIRKRALLLAVLPLLSLLTLFTPLFSPTAAAVTANDVLDRARAWSILNAVIDARGDMKSRISTGDADSCNIMNDANNVYVGHHVTNVHESGDADWESLRGNTGMVNAALNSVGIQGGCRGLLEKIGYTFDGGDLVQPGDFGNRLSERIRAALVPNAFFGANIGDGGPGDAISYAILYYYLKNVCGWQYRNSYDPGAQTTEGSRSREAQSNGATGENAGQHYHTYTYEAGKAGDNVYFKNGGTDNDVRVGSKTGFAPSGNNDAELDCGDNNADTFGAKLADNPRFANAYAALIKPGGATTPGTCEERYSNELERAACADGYNNKPNPNYCSEKYTSGGSPIPGTYVACEYGRTTATAATGITPTDGGAGEDAEDTVTCKIVGIGWIICPVVTFLAQITDGAYNLVVSNMLEVEPLSSASGSGLFTAWSVMRNFANVTFVIAFLIIIFSQISSIGISNYGIKKMLPKLIVAAILVNVSYWVCAIAVDVSNILGSSLYKLLLNTQSEIGIPLSQAGTFSSGSGWTDTAGPLLAGTLAVGAAFFVVLAVFLPLLVAVLATIITVFLALILRQVLIIILIVLSPLAFVASLLPNTASLAKNYFSVFKTLLMIYPIVAIVFGGSALASTIIMASSKEIFIQIAGAAAAVIPLVAVPALMKVINGVGSRFGLPNIGVKLEGMKKGAQGMADRQKGRQQISALGGNRLSQIRSMGRHTRRAKREAIDAGVKAEAGRAQSDYVAKSAIADEAFRNRLAGGRTLGTDASAEALNRALAGAVNIQAKVEADEVTAASAVIKSLNLDRNQAVMRELSMGGSAGGLDGSSRAIRAAAMKNVIDSHDVKGVNNLLDNVGTMDQKTRESFADSLASSSQKPQYVGQSALTDIRQHGNQGVDAAGNPITVQAKSSTELAVTAINNNTYSVDKIASGDREELEYIAGVAANPATPTNNTRLAANAAAAKADPRYAGQIAKNIDVVDNLERL